MTLPVFFAGEEGEHTNLPAPGDFFDWTGAESDHARKVQRLSAGDQLELTNGRGLRQECTILSVGERSLTLEVGKATTENPPPFSFTLVQALAKGGRDEQAVEMCTELGADRIVPWQADRSIVRWPENRAEKGRRKWVATVRSATKQSRRSWEPEVSKVITSRDLAKWCREQATAGQLVLIAHESATLPAVDAVEYWTQKRSEGQITVVVGPEGGISESELDAFTAAGGQAISLGRSVLRSSTAGAVALVTVNLVTGRWQ